MKNNSAYAEMEHPRWGVIMAVQVTKEEAAKLSAGDELFTYYGYAGPTILTTFPWYAELYEKYEPQILERQNEIRRKEKENSTEWKALMKKKAELEENKKVVNKAKKKKNKNKEKNRVQS